MIIKPEISIIFALDNCQDQDGLRRSLDSILFQSFLDFEMIIVDDGYCSESTQICYEYARLNPRVKYCCRKVPQEFFEGMKKVSKQPFEGAEMCSGRYLLFLSRGEELSPSILEDLYHKMMVLGDDWVKIGKYTLESLEFSQSTLLERFWRNIYCICVKIFRKIRIVMATLLGRD